MTRSVQVGVLGFGSVGTGVIKLLKQNHAQLLRRSGVDLKIAAIAVRNKRKDRAVRVNPKILTEDPFGIVKDPRIDIVIELLGGIHPAKRLVEEALKNGKYVVTANKELIAKHGYALFSLARRCGVDLYYEASVAGGIPIIRTLKVGFAPNRITDVVGIINGTTNFILSAMDQGRSYAEALAEAQARGFAEADPRDDVDGVDAAYKLAILASIAFQAKVRVEDVYRQGIRQVDPIDIEFARTLGYTVKLLARGSQTAQGISLKVHPTLIERTHPLANVSGVFNAVFIRGDFIGDAMLYGQGAGSEPTGAAVVSDVLDIVYSFGQNVTRRNLVTEYRHVRMLPRATTTAQFYARFELRDRPGVLARITHLLGRHHISVESIEQKLLPRQRAMLVLITHRTLERHMDQALLAIRRLPDVQACRACLRVGL